eukprot:CAMPEP_0196582468 /NCGR_PEP_ID=MMETSP1081-20130531/39008_1 /TAXON_ID=36882 /ORGANISM="Pyramimonas amylifera, Strain CCMP720" /LENGTH=269 /DNA_ID=CAMNT_0041903027 /DNA_START=76 /DNA_END=885 /DNA_ORIENTATION=-
MLALQNTKTCCSTFYSKTRNTYLGDIGDGYLMQTGVSKSRNRHLRAECASKNQVVNYTERVNSALHSFSTLPLSGPKGLRFRQQGATAAIRDVRAHAFGGAARAGGGGRRIAILPMILQVLFFYLLFRGGALGVFLKTILYFLGFLILLSWSFIAFARFMTVSGKCPSCGSSLQLVRGAKVARPCPACRTPVMMDKASKEFVRAGPSWEQSTQSPFQGRAGFAGYAQQKPGKNSTRPENRNDEPVGEVIDVEVVDVTPLDREQKDKDSL